MVRCHLSNRSRCQATGIALLLNLAAVGCGYAPSSEPAVDAGPAAPTPVEPDGALESPENVEEAIAEVEVPLNVPPEDEDDEIGIADVGVEEELEAPEAPVEDEENPIAALLGDCNGNGLTDLDELILGLDPCAAALGPDNDGDGLPNGDDDDIDDDGLLNSGDLDVDGDGVPNETDADVDGDELFNDEDDDIDGDGLLNGFDLDVDGDGFDNDNDQDADADGAEDEEEDDDDDNDDEDDEEDEIKPCEFDLPADKRDPKCKYGDNPLYEPPVQEQWMYNPLYEPPAEADKDGDGILNGADSDDDNDGTVDWEDADNGHLLVLIDQEIQSLLGDVDKDGIPDGLDEDDDNDGTPDELDLKPLDGVIKDLFKFFTRSDGDADNDGIPDDVDPDDDNDGTSDTSDFDDFAA